MKMVKQLVMDVRIEDEEKLKYLVSNLAMMINRTDGFELLTPISLIISADMTKFYL